MQNSEYKKVQSLVALRHCKTGDGSKGAKQNQQNPKLKGTLQNPASQASHSTQGQSEQAQASKAYQQDPIVKSWCSLQLMCT